MMERSFSTVFWTMLPSFLTGIGAIAATLIVTAASGWLQFRPTPAEVSIRPSSIDLYQEISGSFSSTGVKTSSFVVGSLVMQKAGDAIAGICHLQMRTERGISVEQLEVFPNITLEGDVDSPEWQYHLDVGADTFQRRVLFVIPLDGDAPFARLTDASFLLNCDRSVSKWEPFPLADRLCRLDEFRLDCIRAGWTP